MKLYIAGMYAANFYVGSRLYSRLTETEKKYRASIPNTLESYHYVHKQSFVDRMRNTKVRIFLDSGAFSAFTQNVEIDLEEYCNYIKTNPDIIEVASVLDGIGDAQKTYENQCLMERLGTKPLPCFHYGEDERYLEYYIDKYDHITIGGMVPISTKPLRVWLDRIWNKYLTDGSGRPLLKVHGFGLTTYSLMCRYPWFSVDSSAWVQQAATGSLYMEKYGSIPVSSSSSALKQFGRHLDNLPKEQRDLIIKEIEKDGFEIQRVRDQYLARWTYNSWSYTKIAETITNSTNNDPVFKVDQIGLF